MHSKFLENIKRSIGASYVSYVNYKNTFGIKVIKDKKEQFFSLNGRPSDVTPQKYLELKNKLEDFYAVG